MADRKQFMVEDARVIFRNFAGNEQMYNTAGDRNFCVILDEDTAAAMLADGWNVKRLKPREEDEVEEGSPYIKVTVSYKSRPPLVVMLTSKARTHLDESSVEVLDYADLETVDLIATGFEWDVNGKTGTSAYLKSMFATVREDDLERKYAARMSGAFEEPKE